MSFSKSPLSAEFPEEGEQLLDEEGHTLQRVKTNSVQGILRNRDIIINHLKDSYSFVVVNFIFQ